MLSIGNDSSLNKQHHFRIEHEKFDTYKVFHLS